MKQQILKYLIVAFLVFSPFVAHAQASHFWDGIEDFDGPTERNPLMKIQLDYYFDSLVSPLPDSICAEIDRLLARPISTELRDFILWHLLDRYQNPDYMSQDQVFVYLYDNYFSQLEINDLKEENLMMIADKAERLRRLQLFNIAPNIKGCDLQGNPFNLHHIDSTFIVLFFFDNDCFICNEEMKSLKQLNISGTAIIAINTNPNEQIADNGFINLNTKDIRHDIFELYDIQSTPLIYVLDKDKRIIAKKIRSDQINKIIQ